MATAEKLEQIQIAQSMATVLIVAPNSVCHQLLDGMQRTLKQLIEFQATTGGLPPLELKPAVEAAGLDFKQLWEEYTLLGSSKPHEGYH